MSKCWQKHHWLVHFVLIWNTVLEMSKESEREDVVMNNWLKSVDIVTKEGGPLKDLKKRNWLKCTTEKVGNEMARLNVVDTIAKKSGAPMSLKKRKKVVDEEVDDGAQNGVSDGRKIGGHSNAGVMNVTFERNRNVDLRKSGEQAVPVLLDCASDADVVDLTVSDAVDTIRKKMMEEEVNDDGLQNRYNEKQHSASDAGVIDLTIGDEMVTDDVVWGGEASTEDIVQINKMLRSGVGVFGSITSKLVVKKSLLEGAGRGVFVKEGSVIRDGECITQYSGRTVRSTRDLSVKEQLRTVEIGDIFVVGKEKLVEGDGFGSLVNSSVVGRTLSFCRFVSYRNSVYNMAHCKRSEYPLCGSMELYLTAGSGWWSLFNSVRGKS